MKLLLIPLCASGALLFPTVSQDAPAAAPAGPPGSVAGKALFEGKGISLDRRAGPYLDALREAFRREEDLRRLTERSQDALQRASRDLGNLDVQWERQLGQLRDLQHALQQQKHRLHEGVHRLHTPARTVLCPGSVELPFVPGPDALQ